MIWFDYNKDIMANLIANLSKMENAPMSQLSFGVKDEKNIKRNILKEAYKEVKERALAIALSAGKTLKVCEKVDFKPLFSASYISSSMLDGTMMRQSEVYYSGAVEKITNVFVSEDIELTETVYSL